MPEGVRYLIWDVDGTLYKSDEGLLCSIRQEVYSRIADKLGLALDDAKKLFQEYYERLGGATAAVVKMGLSRRLITEASEAVDKAEYLHSDERLKHMLKVEFKAYRQLIVTNTSREGTLRALEILGIDVKIFEAMITADDVEHSKPHPEAFVKALGLTNVPAQAHTSIGDREAVDIVPAKRLGMRTMMVGGESKLAGYSVPTVYEVPEALKRSHM